jgi:hypothetical protein
LELPAAGAIHEKTGEIAVMVVEQFGGGYGYSTQIHTEAHPKDEGKIIQSLCVVQITTFYFLLFCYPRISLIPNNRCF